MKKYVFALFALILLAGNSCQEKIDIEKEKEAIIAVIEGEIKTSFDGDYESWASFFVHEPYMVWLQATKTQYVYYNGWDELNSEVKKFMTPDRAGKVIFEGNYDYSIKVYKDAALASFKSKLTQVQDNKELESVEVRSLEKKNGDWKIAYLGTVRLTTYDDKEPEESEEEAEAETEETE